MLLTTFHSFYFFLHFFPDTFDHSSQPNSLHKENNTEATDKFDVLLVVVLVAASSAFWWIISEKKSKFDDLPRICWVIFRIEKRKTKTAPNSQQSVIIKTVFE